LEIILRVDCKYSEDSLLEGQSTLQEGKLLTRTGAWGKLLSLSGPCLNTELTIEVAYSGYNNHRYCTEYLVLTIDHVWCRQCSDNFRRTSVFVHRVSDLCLRSVDVET
jgi:hypothetical protein